MPGKENRKRCDLYRHWPAVSKQIDVRHLPPPRQLSLLSCHRHLRPAGKEAIDHGVRLIGLPSGYQMTSLIAAIQAVSFQGSSLEAKTRIVLQGLDQDVRLELLTAANDEGGAAMAKTLFGLAVASPYIRSFLIMADVFPWPRLRYSAKYLPHLVINGRSHIDGIIEEEKLLQEDRRRPALIPWPSYRHL